MKHKLLLLTTLIFGLLTAEFANAQTEQIRTDGVYYALMTDRPPLTLVLVFDGAKVQQYYEYGRRFGEKQTEQGKYLTEDGVPYKLEDRTLKFSTSEGEYEILANGDELRTKRIGGTKKKSEQLTLKFKKYAE